MSLDSHEVNQNSLAYWKDRKAKASVANHAERTLCDEYIAHYVHDEEFMNDLDQKRERRDAEFNTRMLQIKMRTAPPALTFFQILWSPLYAAELFMRALMLTIMWLAIGMVVVGGIMGLLGYQP